MSNDEEVPSVVQNVSDIALDVAIAVVLGGKQVTRPRVMALFKKRVAHDTRELAGDEDGAECGLREQRAAPARQDGVNNEGETSKACAVGKSAAVHCVAAMSESDKYVLSPMGKVADRPHRWTIALSLLAACISVGSVGLSWMSLNEARENRRINEQTARAYLKVTSFLLDDALFSTDNWAGKSLTGFITITNTGRVAAKGVSASLDLNPPRAENLFTIATFPELAPGSSNTTRVIVRMEHSRSMTELKDTGEYVLSMKMEYLDGVNRDKQSDDTTFCFPVGKTKLKGTVSLYPCDTHFASDTVR